MDDYLPDDGTIFDEIAKFLGGDFRAFAENRDDQYAAQSKKKFLEKINNPFRKARRRANIILSGKCGGARPGAGRKDRPTGERRNYQFDWDTIKLLDRKFPVAHRREKMLDGTWLNRSEFINRIVRDACLEEIEWRNSQTTL
jgi:hypothetical protein